MSLINLAKREFVLARLTSSQSDRYDVIRPKISGKQIEYKEVSMARSTFWDDWT